MSTAAVPAAPAFSEPAARPGLIRAFGFIFFSFFLCNLCIPDKGYIGNLPFTFLLKDHLHKNASEVALFFAVASFAWYLKPLCGLLSDSFPILGTRRRSYVLIGSASAAFFWILSIFVPKSYGSLLVIVAAIDAMLVMSAASWAATWSGRGATARLPDASARSATQRRVWLRSSPRLRAAYSRPVSSAGREASPRRSWSACFC